MNSQAKSTMVNGLIAQFTNKVTATGFGVFPASVTFLKIDLHHDWIEIKKRQMATGMET